MCSTRPANDPFVITVGAADLNGSVDPTRRLRRPVVGMGLHATTASRKPELGGPGRYMNGAVPTAGSTMESLHPERDVAPGYMWMSGTSFAAPVVAGGSRLRPRDAPDWTPDQVKGALMVSAAEPSGYTGGGALGVGEVDG